MAATVEQPSMGKSSFWRFPAGQDLGHALFLIGFGLLVYGLFTVGYPNFLIPIFCAVGGAILVERGVTKWFTPPKFGDDEPEDMPMFDPMMGFGGYPGFDMGGELHPMISKIINLANSKFPEKMNLDPDMVEFEDDPKTGDKKVVAWGFTCNEPGFLTKDAIQLDLQNTFSRGTGERWSFTFDEAENVFSATQKSNIPTLVFPPKWEVVHTAAEAKEKYHGWEFVVGETADGPVSFSPEVFPHVLAIGETGSGKSVAIRSWLEQWRTISMLVLLDGKGADYAGYRGQNGVVAIGLGGSPKGMEYVAGIVLVYQIMMQRQMGSAEAKVNDAANWNKFPPVLMVMDEIKSMMGKWKNSLGKEFDTVKNMVEQILALGRELRVHGILVTQDVYDTSIPGPWRVNLPLTVSIGKPGDMTLKKGFPEKVAAKARMIGEAMNPKTKGRCLVTAVDDETGAAQVVEYQGYIGYSPGESWDNPKVPKQAKGEWPEFKKDVSDAIPRLWSRQWFRFDEPSEAQRKKEEKEGELGFIDIDLFTVSEIMQLKRVNLDMRVDGEIVPDPSMAKYDPLSPEYVCRPVMRGDTFVSEEL